MSVGHFQRGTWWTLIRNYIRTTSAIWPEWFFVYLEGTVLVRWRGLDHNGLMNVLHMTWRSTWTSDGSWTPHAAPSLSLIIASHLCQTEFTEHVHVPAARWTSVTDKHLRMFPPAPESYQEDVEIIRKIDDQLLQTATSPTVQVCPHLSNDPRQQEKTLRMSIVATGGPRLNPSSPFSVT